MTKASVFEAAEVELLVIARPAKRAEAISETSARR
jgi:hypothetical protein